MSPAPPDAPILAIEDLSVSFAAEGGVILANDGVSLSISRGETLGIVGESGSGKSVLCRAILRLLPSPPATINAKRLSFEGRDLLGLDPPALCAMRGRDIAMVFQNPMTSLDPVQPIASQVAEPLRLHRGLSRRAARAGAIELLERVGIASAASRCDEYPHQWSGGMLQRASIAMAMAAEPKLLLADEPTTALDVTIQDQILALLLDLQRETGMAMVLVSHDMGVIAESADRLAVMYAGRIVEIGTTREIFENAAHPYSRGLLDSIPRADERVRRLRTIPGQPPDLSLRRPGCPFRPRCAVASDDCGHVAPAPRLVAPGHATLCLHPERVGAPSRAEAAA
jgi:oligopeptide/dipeptide ABC transporter ATP-binding protein